MYQTVTAGINLRFAMGNTGWAVDSVANLLCSVRSRIYYVDAARIFYMHVS